MTVRMCIFSNCTNDVLARPTIFDTYNSWTEVFGNLPKDKISIYVDPHPNPQFLKAYIKKIVRTLGIEPEITSGLSEGYYRALTESSEEYLIMNEHDWQFLSTINHTLAEIIAIMERDGLWYMTFNRLNNDNSLNGTKWQTYMKEATSEYCLTDRVSNNPHIVNRRYYLYNIAHRVDWTLPGAGRIEQVLQKNGLEVAMYGPFGSPPTIKHLDGRKHGKK